MKKKSQEKQSLKNGSVLDIKFSETSFEQKYSRYFWIIIPVLAILYYSYRKISMGFYQDDEVAQYINMLQFWRDPWAILGNGPKPGFLEAVKSACNKNGAVFILDEVKTGFRFALGGAQEYLGVTPDLATFGKAMANGYDIGVVVGKRDILEEAGVYLAATFHAHLLGIAATMATIDEMQRIDGISLVWRQGQKLIDGLDEIARRHGVEASCKGYAPMPLLKFDESAKDIGTRFWEGAARRGVYFSPSHPWFISPAHDDAIIEQTLAASEEAMAAAVA